VCVFRLRLVLLVSEYSLLVFALLALLVNDYQGVTVFCGYV